LVILRGFIKTLIEDERTIGYEAQRNETKRGPISRCLGTESYLFLRRTTGADFKELFKRLAAAGAGRPPGGDGFPAGPWTPELLAEAISQIDSNLVGVDLRTVQLWFQENEKGSKHCQYSLASEDFWMRRSCRNQRMADGA
jgi:hypothetical protein